MDKLSKPVNCYAFAVLLLIENYSAGVSPVTYMKNKFHKFPWRLREVAKSHPKLTFLNNSATSKTRYGTVCTYKVIVPTCSIHYLKNLYNVLNK